MKLSILGFLIYFINITASLGQVQETAPGTYILFLTDKNNTSYKLANPAQFLSSRAIERRTKQQIPFDSTDLPVNKNYLDSLIKMGLTIHNVSRWFNTVTIKTGDTSLLEKLNKISFVQKIEPPQTFKVRLNNYTESLNLLSNEEYDSVFYGQSYNQIHVHQGDYLHAKGFRGEGMLLAIIDAGFNNYQGMTAFQSAHDENRILGVKDFVDHDGEVNSDHSHGANVFSIIGGDLPNTFVGTAPKCNFLLLRSEDATNDIFGNQNEYLVEEDNWISAIEYADSIGTDVINTSLGYSTFNNPSQNHTYADMNGHSTRISLAADKAITKGMIVVVSAGNEGDDPWKYISAPADAFDVLTVGAVNVNLARAFFSSMGPTYDGRIKPDAMAIGQGTKLQNIYSQIVQGSGTSFAAPVIAGLTACLWQGAPNKTNKEIIAAIRQAGDNFNTPDNFYGYGIPNFKKALLTLNPDLYEHKGKLMAFPNPFTTQLTLQHEALKENKIIIELYNATGRKISSQEFTIEPNRVGEIELTNLSALHRGILFVRAISGKKILTTTVLKL